MGQLGRHRRQTLRGLLVGVAATLLMAGVGAASPATATTHPTGTVVIQKLVRMPQLTPTPGWTFSSSSAGVTPASQATGPSGSTPPFVVTFDDVTERPLTFTETLQPGFRLEQQADGTNAACFMDDQRVPVTNSGPLGFTITGVSNKTVTCKVINRPVPPAKLTLLKVVENTHGGTATADQWTLSATGPQTLSGTSGVSGDVAPGTYELAESAGPAGYEQAGPWTCDGGTLAGTSLTLASDDDVTCTVRNRDIPPHLTLVKVVQGGGSLPADWTLTAAGSATTITGITGAAAVTFAEVPAGTYQLSESGPPGFTDLGWSCDGGSLQGTTLTLPLATDVICTVTNERVPGPSWTLSKVSDPPTGATVQPGDDITYTLTAENTGDLDIADLVVTDDLSDVLDDAVLDESSIDPEVGTAALTGTDLVWEIDNLAVGATVTLTYTVTVDDDAFGVLLRNVATGEGPPPPTDCPTGTEECVTEHPTPSPVDLQIEKRDRVTGTTDDFDPIVGEGEQFDYVLDIRNVGQTPATNVVMTDEIPDVLTVDPATIAVSEPGWTVTLTGTEADGSAGLLTATFPGPFNPGDEVTITLTVTVGELPQPDPTVPPDDIFNEAEVHSREPDTNPEDNVDDEETPIKAVTLAAAAVCINDTPFLNYDIGAVGLTPTLVTLNWWNPTVWNGGNPTGPPTATQTIPLDQLSGTLLWFGAAVDADGNPTDWPGWTLLPDGTWVEDPNAPGADLRPSAIVQIEVNPDIAAVQVYPPPTPNCNANPPPNTPPGTPGVPPTPGQPGQPGAPGAPGGRLPRTGAEPMIALWAGTALIVAGAGLQRLARRIQTRRVRQTRVV